MSFRARLAVAMGALILAIAAAISIWLPRKLEDEAMALMTHKAETLAQLTAFTIQPSIYFHDRAALDEALSGTRNDKDVAYVIVTDPAGRTLSAFHPERRGGKFYETTLPMRDGNQEIARLVIGMSTARLERQVVRMRIAIGIVSAVILAAGLIIVVLISNLLTRPLRDVATGAQRIAAGDLAHRVPVGRRDEIGRLAASFNEMSERVAERDASLRRLSRRLLSIQEQERIRIAREVHDELGQALTAMKIDLQQKPLADIAKNIDTIVDLVRRIATDLRPAILDDLGITAALEQQLRRLRETTGIKTTLEVDEEPELDMLAAATLYRIAKEALANVVRHASASEVNVTLEVRDDNLVLDIRDNGIGMTADRIGAQSLGIIGMRERAELLGGTVEIDSHPGRGTRVTTTLPSLQIEARYHPRDASPLR